MKIDPASLEELKRICEQCHGKSLSDQEADEVGRRIVRFIVNAEDCFPPAPPLTQRDGVR